MKELSYEQAKRGSTGGDIAVFVNCTQKKNDDAEMIGNLYYSEFHGAIRKAIREGPFNENIDIYVLSRRAHDADYGIRPLHEQDVEPYDNLLNEDEHEEFVQMAYEWFIEHDDDYKQVITFISNRFEDLIDKATLENSGCEDFSTVVSHAAGRARIDRVCQLHELMYRDVEQNEASMADW